jgi:predicted transposase YbfD/YdcC
VSYFEESDAGHGRCEVRRHWLVKDLSTLPEPENWAKLQSIGMVESERHEGEKISRERRYYITTLAEDAKVFGNAVRTHWGVENQLHWALDVVFREDESRIRRDNAPANFNALRQFSLRSAQALCSVHECTAEEVQSGAGRRLPR